MAIYLDNAATTHPKPPEVYEAVQRALRDIGANPGRGGHKLSLAASRIVFDCRDELASFFNAGKASCIVFTSNATEALNIAIKGVLRPGDEVVTSRLEHNSMTRPLMGLAERSGVTVRFAGCDSNGFISPDDVVALFTPRTRLVALTHASNVIGSIQDVAPVFEEARKRGIYTLLDVAQTAGVEPIDVQAMHVDLLAAAGHKGLLGPQGTGVLYVRDGIELAPFKEGGTGTNSSSLLHPLDMPERLEAGTLNTPGIAGLHAGIAFIRRTGIDVIARRERMLVRRIIDGLSTIPGVTLYGPASADRHASPVAFNLDRLDCSETGFILDEIYDIYVRVGLHCAPLVHEVIGAYPQGTVRVSPGFFTSESDIETFLASVRELSRR